MSEAVGDHEEGEVEEVEDVANASLEDIAAEEEGDDEAGEASSGVSAFNFRKQVKKEGTGDIPPKGALVRVHYVAWLQDGGLQVEPSPRAHVTPLSPVTPRQVDSSRDRGAEPIAFLLGKGEVVQGVDHVVSSMQVGEICHATLPPEMAYGPEGWPPKVPGGATIEMDLELIGFTPSEVPFPRPVAERGIGRRLS